MTAPSPPFPRTRESKPPLHYAPSPHGGEGAGGEARPRPVALLVFPSARNVCWPGYER